MLEGVAAVEDAVGVTSLAGDVVFVVPKPACASACLGRIEEAGAVITCSDAGREWRTVASLWRASMIISRRASSRIMMPPATAR